MKNLILLMLLCMSSGCVTLDWLPEGTEIDRTDRPGAPAVIDVASVRW